MKKGVNFKIVQKTIFFFLSILIYLSGYAQVFQDVQVITCDASIVYRPHSLAIDNNGNLWGWGWNDYGQVGNGSHNIVYSPEIINPTIKYKQIACGDYHSVSIDTSGYLWTWGRNNYGQLGNGTTTDENLPVQIFKGVRFKFVEANGYVSFAIDELGNLWSWGRNDYGQLGDGTFDDKNAPTQIIPGIKFKYAVTGGNHSAAIDEMGDLWTWGNNDDWQLGTLALGKQPRPLKILTENSFKLLSFGYSCSYAIDENGILWGWGLINKDGITGRNLPFQVIKDLKFKKIKTSSSEHTLAVDESGKLWGWGSNQYYQLSSANVMTYSTPEQLLKNLNFKDISLSSIFSQAIDESGSIFCWGLNSGLGTGEVLKDNTIPRKVPFDNADKISAGRFHTAVLTGEGVLFTWGNDNLGDGSGMPKDSAINILPHIRFKDVDAGFYHTLGLDKSGKIWAWGNASDGRLGNGSFFGGNIPVKIINEEVFIAISAGSHSLAIDKNGRLWAWGGNNYGQLGDSAYDKTNVPIIIPTENKFKFISAGADHSLAIDESGYIWAWGRNDYGTLGDGTKINKKVPVRIKSDNKFMEIAAGQTHSLAIDVSGKLWGWGRNIYGQLGTKWNNYVIHTEPIQINNEIKYKHISSCYNTCFAIDEDGFLWSWGLNESGELGLGFISSHQPEPTKISTKLKFKEVTSGMYHEVAIDEYGNLLTWGSLGALAGDGKALQEIPIRLNNGNVTSTKLISKESELAVFGTYNKIIIKSKKQGNYCIYNLFGSKILQGNYHSGEKHITINSGIYIFCSDDYSVKVFVY